MRLSTALLLLLSLLAAPLLPAAEPAFTNAAEAEADAAAGNEATADSDDQAGIDDSEDSEEATAPTARAPGEDFVPSVRISEDLSVSFPTDI